MGKKIMLNGSECTNMATLNFLNMLGDKDVEVNDVSDVFSLL